MKKLRRAALMVGFHISRVLLKPVDSLAPRTYMRAYLALLRMAGVQLTGAPRYISGGVKFDEFGLISMGERVVLSDKVILLTHDYSLTTALIALGDVPPTDLCVRRGVSIGNNVFVGMGAVLLPGTTIGDNVIIGAGSVVRGEVPANSVLLGNPARVIGTITDLGERWRSHLKTPIVAAD